VYGGSRLRKASTEDREGVEGGSLPQVKVAKLKQLYFQESSVMGQVSGLPSATAALPTSMGRRDEMGLDGMGR